MYYEIKINSNENSHQQMFKPVSPKLGFYRTFLVGPICLSLLQSVQLCSVVRKSQLLHHKTLFLYWLCLVVSGQVVVFFRWWCRRNQTQIKTKRTNRTSVFVRVSVFFPNIVANRCVCVCVFFLCFFSPEKFICHSFIRFQSCFFFRHRKKNPAFSFIH